jgi:hypothetical protein
MQETIDQLKKILADIFEQAERRLKIEQIDLKEFDDSLNNSEITDRLDERDLMLKFREKVVKYKGDNSFWEKDIPNLIALLESSKERIQNYRADLIEIGGKNLPNEDIVNLIKQGILTTETPISKTHKNKELVGHLTIDGYLELMVRGISKKLGLIRAAIEGWGSDPSNQWDFWEAPDINGEKKSLEHFRSLLKK